MTIYHDPSRKHSVCQDAVSMAVIEERKQP